MSRRTVMATLKAGKGADSYRARYPSPQMSHIGTGALLGAQSIVYANGSGSSVGSVLIDKIAEISSTATKYTTIECTATYGVVPQSRSGRAGLRDESQLIISNFSLFIDWDQGTVVYQGKYTFPGATAGSTEWQFYNGTSSISEAGGSVTMSATNDHMGSGQRSAVAPVLKYNINRHVTGVPVIDGPSHLMGYFSLHSYTITTDDGINVTAAPTPPETPEVAPVVGVKISELNAVSSLQDDDLFVLSQDDASDGTYDSSWNVTLANLTASIAEATSLSSRAVRGYASGDFIGSDGTGAQTITSSSSVTLGAKTYKVLAGLNGWLLTTTLNVNVELQYELNGSGTWVQFADIKQHISFLDEGKTVSPMGIAEFVAPSAGSYKFRVESDSATLLIHDFSVILL